MCKVHHSITCCNKMIYIAFVLETIHSCEDTLLIHQQAGIKPINCTLPKNQSIMEDIYDQDEYSYDYRRLFRSTILLFNDHFRHCINCRDYERAASHILLSTCKGIFIYIGRLILQP